MSNLNSPEVLLAAILAAYHETNGLHISFELKEAIETAEENFDGPEIVDMLVNGDTVEEVLNRMASVEEPLDVIYADGLPVYPYGVKNMKFGLDRK